MDPKEEILKKIEEALSRVAHLPDEMEIRETFVPLKVRDPKDQKKMIDDPHGRSQQSRIDVFDKSDSFKKPVIHFHAYPDHPVYEKNWRPYAEAFIHLKSDILYLTGKLKEELCK